MGGGGDWMRRLGRGPNGRTGALIALTLLSGALATGACTLPDATGAHEAIPVPAVAPPEAGATLLHVAAGFGSDPYMIKALIEAGADPDARADNGATPLHWAAEHNSNPSVIKALIEGGADPAARDDAGKVPFDYAKENSALRGTDAYWLLNEGRFE